MNASRYHAVVIGGTGAVGSNLVRELLASPRCEAVTILVRRHTDLFSSAPGHDKLRERVIDMNELERQTAASSYDVAFCTMGIGQARKVSKEELHRVELEYPTAFARGARTAGARHITLMTAVGTTIHSRFSYVRMKGEAEAGVLAAGIARTSFFRPSLLVTPQLRYGLQDRITQFVVPLITPILPARFHEIRVEDLGRAMRINAERDGSGVEILNYPEIEALLRSDPR